MNRSVLALLSVSAGLALASPAMAHWSAGGSGSGQATVALMPAGAQPSASASARDVTVSWSQSTFAGGRLGALAGGGYTVRRYPSTGSTSVTPASACDGTVSGSAATLQCVETSVPYGAWRYSITPVLRTFTGAESAAGATVTVAPAAPTLASVVAQNPGSGQATGAIGLSWGAVTGATGYDVYRRTSAGAYDYTSPLNGATPVSATTYSDPGSGLTGGTTYDYVVRAVAGSPAVESASSGELGATAIARPAAPAGSVTATPQAAAHIAVAWTAVGGAAGYNVYRRTTAGSFDFTSPLNGATPVASAAYTDSGSVNATAYVYAVRAVIIGAGGAQVESTTSAESAAATADSVAPSAATAITVGSGGNVLAAATCARAAGTRFINAAGAASVSMTVTLPAPEAGESLFLSATTAGSTAVTSTVAAGSTSVTTTMNLGGLLDGTVTLTAATQDAAGNRSATTVTPANAIVKDVVAGALSGLTYTDNLLALADTIGGTSECGALITATETAGSNVGRTFPVTGSFTVGATGAFTGFAVDAVSGTILGKPYGYAVVATDLAGNASASVTISGTDTL